LAAYLGVNAWVWLIFVLALSLGWRTQPDGLIRPLMLWAVAFRLAGFCASPVMEDDYFRFLWDGRQFALTGNPYATAPSSHFADQRVPEQFRVILDQINYPHVPTIYGPVCQASFAVSYWIAPGQLWPWKLITLGVDLVALFLIFKLTAGCAGIVSGESEDLRAVGMVPVLVFGWCPPAVFETSFNAHPDILGVALLLAALVCRRSKAMSACAAFCALAVASKVIALLFVPFLLGRKAKSWVVFTALVAACYCPFWLQGSLADWGGLSAFAAGWEFNSSVYAIAGRLLEPSRARLMCGMLFALLWGTMLIRWLAAGRDARAEGIPPGALLFGIFLLLSATVNPWYLLWLLPFVALRPTLAGLTAFAAVSLSYLTGLNLGNPTLDNFAHPSWVRPIEYGAVALAAAADGLRHLRFRSVKE